MTDHDLLVSIVNQLNTLTSKQDKMEQILTKISVDVETTVTPKLDLLYEGHVTLQRQLQDRANAEELQEIKSDVRLHTDAIKKINETIKSIQDDVKTLKHA